MKITQICICVGLVLLLQSCTSEPKLEFQSTLKRGWKAPSTEHWQNGVTTTVDGHLITRGENDNFYTLSSYNASGQKDGLFAQYSKGVSTGTAEKTYTNGVLNGMFRMYDTDTPYVNGVKEGIEREFRKGSNMVRSTPYHQGKKHGVEQIFSYTTGHLEKRVTYAAGTKKRIEHYCKRKISLRTEMDGCRHGMEKSWYCGTDILKKETPYVACKRHGTEKVYDKQGRLKYSITYRKGLKEGEAKEYYPDGKMKYKVIYQGDKVNEIGYFYDKYGKKERIDYDTIMKFSDRFPACLEEWRL